MERLREIAGVVTNCATRTRSGWNAFDMLVYFFFFSSLLKIHSCIDENEKVGLQNSVLDEDCVISCNVIAKML